MATTTQAPPAELRRAASLMRERAQAATPGPWRHMCMGSDGCLVIRDSGTIRERGHGRVAKFGQKEWKPDHFDADFVSSWSPPVALAVADWLEDTARQADENLTLDTPECGHADAPCGCGPMVPAWACDRCGEYLVPGGCSCWDKALAVARAYLEASR